MANEVLDVEVLVPYSREDMAELTRYAPAVVVWPIGQPGDPPPWPGGIHDYHPHVVDIYGDVAKLRRPMNATFMGQTPIWVLQKVFFRLLPTFGIHVDLTEILFWLGLVLASVGIAGNFTGVVVGEPLFLILALAAIALSVALPERLTTTRRGSAAIAAEVGKDLVGGRADRVISLDGPADPRAAWRQYLAIEHETARYPRTVYGRRFDGPGGPTLQYWMFFFYNHWRNVHEADWEVVTITLDAATRMPVAVGVSSHENGLRREWASTMKVEDHPLVFVAVGSHALYFEPRMDGYDATAGFQITNDLIRASVTIAVGRERDLPPPLETDGGPPLHTGIYHLREMPDPRTLVPGTEAWHSYWWLRFRGRWGRVASIRSPWAGGPRWEDPAEWVSRMPSG